MHRNKQLELEFPKISVNRLEASLLFLFSFFFGFVFGLVVWLGASAIRKTRTKSTALYLRPDTTNKSFIYIETHRTRQLATTDTILEIRGAAWKTIL